MEEQRDLRAELKKEKAAKEQDKKDQRGRGRGQGKGRGVGRGKAKPAVVVPITDPSVSTSDEKEGLSDEEFDEELKRERQSGLCDELEEGGPKPKKRAKSAPKAGSSPPMSSAGTSYLSSECVC